MKKERNIYAHAIIVSGKSFLLCKDATNFTVSIPSIKVQSPNSIAQSITRLLTNLFGVDQKFIKQEPVFFYDYEKTDGVHFCYLCYLENNEIRSSRLFEFAFDEIDKITIETKQKATLDLTQEIILLQYVDPNIS